MRDLGREVSPKLGGCYSIRMHGSNLLRAMYMGQDEAVCHQHTMHSCCWTGTEDQMVMRPKNEGGGKHMSGIISGQLPWDPKISEAMLNEINLRRAGTDYISEEDAIFVKGTKNKHPLTQEDLPFLISMLIGVNNEGYWTSSHTAIQIEDLADVLKVYRPNCEHILSIDHSSGHTKARPHALNIANMSVGYGGTQPQMRDSTVTSLLGQFPGILLVGDEQRMWYDPNDTTLIGPYDLTPAEREATKYDTDDGPAIEKGKTKAMLVKELTAALIDNQRLAKALKNKSVGVLQKLATKHGIPITYQFQKKRQGWLGKPKGMLQILFERGFIDPTIAKPKSHYAKYGRKQRASGDIIEGTSLMEMMEMQEDFAREPCYMVWLGEQIGLTVILSPKGHPEIAGSGIENGWAVIKMTYRAVPYKDKKTRAKFLASVARCASSDVMHPAVVHGCIRKARNYKCAYLQIHSERIANMEHNKTIDTDALVSVLDPVAMVKIEQFHRQQAKTHRSNLDFDGAEIRLFLNEAEQAPTLGTLPQLLDVEVGSRANRRATIG